MIPNPSSWALRLSMARAQLKGLLEQITKIEQNPQMPDNEKLSQIKKIRDQINDVATEIDTIKKEIKLLANYSIN